MPGKHNKPMKMHGKKPMHVREGFKHKHVDNPKKGEFVGKNKQNLSSHDTIAIPSKKDHNAMKYNKPMDGHSKKPAKINAGVGLHGPFKMVMGAHDKNSPGIMKAHHVQKFSYMYPQGNKFIGELNKAKKAGDSSFTVDGKEYQVRMEKPMDGHSKPMEYHGPNAYNGPNMADMPMKYPREDYTAKGNVFDEKAEEADEKSNKASADRSDAQKKLDSARNTRRKNRQAKRDAAKARRKSRRADRIISKQ